MLVWAERSTYSVPLPIVAPQLVLDDSVVAQRHPDLAVGQVESQQRDGSAAAYVEYQPFGRLGVDVEGEVGPDKYMRRRNWLHMCFAKRVSWLCLSEHSMQI